MIVITNNSYLHPAPNCYLTAPFLLWYVVNHRKEVFPMYPVAILASEARVPESIEACTQIQIYVWAAQGWRIQNTIPCLIDGSSADALRTSLKAAVAPLSGDHILLARSIGGLAYHILDQMGFAIFEASDLSEALLDDMARDVEAARRTETETPLPPYPVETEHPGHYSLDLIRLLQAYPDISSKRAIQPFLSGPFQSLTVLCGHIPPWIPDQADQWDITYVSEPNPEGGIRLTLYKKRPL
jgi:Fe-only nitrogenase accessory protein AnfO